MRRFISAAMAVMVIAVVAPAQAGPYVAGGTAVYRENGNTRADDGIVTCISSTGAGIGGACLPFGPAVGVVDVALGTEIAFQVCIDNNGDGVCTDFGQEPDGKGCTDQVYFSHSDDGSFHNPLGPLPTGFAPGCAPSTGWKGFVVFVCEGVHVPPDGSAAGGPPHVHPATSGTISIASAGTGYGNFCGSTGRQRIEKDYKVIP